VHQYFGIKVKIGSVLILCNYRATMEVLSSEEKFIHRSTSSLGKTTTVSFLSEDNWKQNIVYSDV